MPLSQKSQKETISLFSNVYQDDSAKLGYTTAQKIYFTVKFTSKYTDETDTVILFKAYVNFNAIYNPTKHTFTKTKICVSRICYENESESSSSHYPYYPHYPYFIEDVSCSDDDSKCSYNARYIEKQIIKDVTSFFNSDAFLISKNNDLVTVTLDVNEADPVIYYVAKTTFRYKISNCKIYDSTSDCSCKKPKKKWFIIFIIAIILYLIFKITKFPCNNYIIDNILLKDLKHKDDCEHKDNYEHKDDCGCNNYIIDNILLKDLKHKDDCGCNE